MRLQTPFLQTSGGAQQEIKRMASVERVDLSPWSPHRAAMQRRRGGGGKPKIDFDKLIEDTSGLDLGASPKGKKQNASASAAAHKAKMLTTKKGKEASAVDAANKAAILRAKKGIKIASDEAAGVAAAKAQKRLSAETAAMFAKLNDRDLPLKERVQIEVMLSKNDATRKMLGEMRYKGGRKSFLNKVEEEKLAAEQQLLCNLHQEEERVKMEEEEKRERAEEEFKRKRQKSFERSQMRKSIANKISKDLETIRLQAEQAVSAVVENAANAVVEESEELDSVQAQILASEDNDVLRNLKEARLNQKATRGTYD